MIKVEEYTLPKPLNAIKLRGSDSKSKPTLNLGSDIFFKINI